MPRNGETRRKDRGADRIRREAAEAAANSTGVKVGFLARDAGRTQIEGAPISNPELATIHEYGAVIRLKTGGKIVIPERSILRATIKTNRGTYKNFVRQIARNMIHGRGTVRQGFAQLGLLIERDIQDRFGASDLAPNKPSTIARKRDSTAPLIDTSQLKNSVNSAVVEKGREVT
jgi:hypothetical protein